MTPRSLLRLCPAFVGATGVGLIANPGFVVRELFGGGFSGDSGMTRGAGFVLLLLSLKCWPNGDEIDGRIIWALLAYNLLTALYLGYLKLVAGFVSTLLWPVFVLHAVIALLLADLAYERVSAAKIGRANQH
jgi:hypothetical protein